MGKYRYDVNERSVRFDLVNGKTVAATAGKYGCSEALVRNIRDGITRRGHKRKPPPVQTREEVPAEMLCICCMERPKAAGNRFLCAVCYKTGDSGTIY